MINKSLENWLMDQNSRQDFIDVYKTVDDELSNIWISVDSEGFSKTDILKEIETKSADIGNYIDQFIADPAKLIYDNFDSRSFIDEMEHKLGIDQSTTNTILTELVRELTK